MNYARLALSATLMEQNLAPLLERGVTPEMFPDPEAAAVYTYVRDFYKQYQAVPSISTVENRFPGFTLGYAPDPAESYVAEIIKQHVRVTAQAEMLAKARALPHGNPVDVAAALQSTFARLTALAEPGQRAKVLTEGASSRYQKYLVRKNTVGVIGIPTPWPSLDDITQGWQPEQYIGVAARPKTGKTFWMLRVAHAAWKAGYDVLFANIELPDDLMERRFDAIDAKLPYESFRRGLLTDADEARYAARLADIEAHPPAKWTWVHGARSVSALAAKIEELKPAIVFIDGAYLMEDEQGARTEREQQKNLSRGFKRLAQRYKVPVIISIQLNRDGDTAKSKSRLTMSNVYGSDAFAQDVDFLFALEQTEDMRLARELQITGLAARDATGENVRIGWDFSTMEAPDLGYSAALSVGSGDDDDDTLTFN